MVAIWLALPLVRRHIPATILVTSIAAICSFLPGAYLNVRYCGDWSGSRLEFGNSTPLPPAPLIAGNMLALSVQNLAPPVFPPARRWNAAIPQLLPAAYHQHIARYFELETANLTVGEIQMEESAGLGCTATLLLLIKLCAGILRRDGGRRSRFPTLALRWSPWLVLPVCLAKLNLVAVARVAIPYYPLVAAAILAGRSPEWLSRRRWWHSCVLLHFAAAALLVVLSPPRPLWPALTVSNQLLSRQPDSPTLRRLQTVYRVYRQRPDVMAPVRKALPQDAVIVGLVTFDNIETSLWRPFITRRFLHVTSGDTAADLDRSGIHWLVVSADAFASQMREPLPDWLAHLNATLVATVPVEMQASRGPVDWYVAKVRSSTNPP
jgi:hypothetical protein